MIMSIHEKSADDIENTFLQGSDELRVIRIH